MVLFLLLIGPVIFAIQQTHNRQVNPETNKDRVENAKELHEIQDENVAIPSTPDHSTPSSDTPSIDIHTDSSAANQIPDTVVNHEDTPQALPHSIETNNEPDSINNHMDKVTNSDQTKSENVIKTNIKSKHEDSNKENLNTVDKDNEETQQEIEEDHNFVLVGGVNAVEAGPEARDEPVLTNEREDSVQEVPGKLDAEGKGNDKPEEAENVGSHSIDEAIHQHTQDSNPETQQGSNPGALELDDHVTQNYPPTVNAPKGNAQNAPVVDNMINTGGQIQDPSQEQVPVISTVIKDSPGELDEPPVPGDQKELPTETSETGTDTVTDTNQKEATGSNPDGDPEPIVVRKDDTDMPSFDEWKARKLAEQEKVKHQEAHKVTQNGGNGHSNGHEKNSGEKAKKNRVNNAAASCGAKILATNAEAKNAGFLLSENRDQYMIQPCSANKWFVVQLCDPVQIDRLELGNLELFSSLPNTFSVQVSDRYPTHNWELLAKRRAHDERSIQSFSIQDSPFVKYMRVEILSHYGTEHYCPLSILRVYGLSVHEDGEEESGELEAEHTEEAAEQHKPSSFLEAAQEKVLNLVHNVLNGNAQPAAEDTSLNKELEDKVTDKVTDKAVDKVTDAIDTGSNDILMESLKPEVPNASSSATPANKSKCTPSPDQPSTPEATVDNQFTPPEEQNPRSLIRLIESPQIPLSVLLNKCEFCEKTSERHECRMDRYSLCGYYSFLTYVYKTSCDDHMNSIIARKGEPETDTADKAINLDEQDSESALKTEDKVSVNSEQTRETQTIDQQHEKDGSNKHQNEASDTQHTADSGKITTESSQTQDSSETETIQGDALVKEETQDQPKTGEKPQSDSLEPPSAVKLGPDVVQIRPANDSASQVADVTSSSQSGNETGSTKPEVEKTEAEPQKGDPGVVVDTDAPAEETNQERKSEGEASKPTDEGQEASEEVKVQSQVNRDKPSPKLESVELDDSLFIPADEHVRESVEEYDHHGASEEITVSRHGSGFKETTYMKLKNKIKELEANLNLSSAYLEELSQRYKRQMEDMYVSLNKTIQRLSNTSKNAEVQDMRQQERIGRLEAVVVNLTDTVHSLHTQLELVHGQVIERHLVLMLIEFGIFIFAMALCLNHQKVHYRERMRNVSESYFNATSKSTLNQTSSQSSSHTSAQSVSPRGHRRGASVDLHTPGRGGAGSHVTSQASTVIPDEQLRKTGSENDITIIAPDTNPFVCKTPKIEDLPKKKKRKKMSQSQLALQKLGQNSQSNPNQSQKPIEKEISFSIGSKMLLRQGAVRQLSDKSSATNNEGPMRRSSTGSPPSAIKSSPPPNPNSMYHSSQNQYSALSANTPKFTNGLGSNIIENESQSSARQSNGVRRRLDVAYAKKNRSASSDFSTRNEPIIEKGGKGKTIQRDAFMNGSGFYMNGHESDYIHSNGQGQSNEKAKGNFWWKYSNQCK